jgi:hypothetical protein
MTTTQQCVVCMLSRREVQGPANHQTMAGMKVAQQRNEFRLRRYATQEPDEPPEVSMKLKGYNEGEHTQQFNATRHRACQAEQPYHHSHAVMYTQPQHHQTNHNPTGHKS